MTVSAFDLIFGFAHELNREAGIPAAKAAIVAALVFCKNSLLFQGLYIFVLRLNLQFIPE
jgi:hypothetical protein